MSSTNLVTSETQPGAARSIQERLRTYRPEHGRYVRLGSFWLLVILWSYGCFRFSETLADLRFGWAAFLRRPVIQELPLLEVSLTPAALVAILVFMLGVAGLQIFLNTPKVAETLIETESELRKVTWPTFKDTVNASLIVLFTVIAMFVLLGVYDAVLGRAADSLFLGR